MECFWKLGGGGCVGFVVFEEMVKGECEVGVDEEVVVEVGEVGYELIGLVECLVGVEEVCL